MNMPLREDQLHSAWAREGRQPRIAIIGAGFSGMGAIIKLREAGYTDITCFEKAEELGGTWRDNTYPGLSCDVPSHWYSSSFEAKFSERTRVSPPRNCSIPTFAAA